MSTTQNGAQRPSPTSTPDEHIADVPPATLATTPARTVEAGPSAEASDPVPSKLRQLPPPQQQPRPLLDPETVRLRAVPPRDRSVRTPPARSAGAEHSGRPSRPRDAARRVPAEDAPAGMDIHDYLRMFRQGWPMLVAITVLGVVLSGAYLFVVPASYTSSTALFVSASTPLTIEELQGGTEFSAKAVTSYADIVTSATVLGSVSGELGVPVEDLQQRVTAAAPEDTRLIDIAASDTDPERAAVIANAVARSATRVLPTLEGTPDGLPLVSVSQLRPAVPLLDSASPSPKKVLAIGLIVGLCVALGVTIARHSLDSRIRRADDVRALTDVPLLAVVPAARRRTQALIARDESGGSAGEAYRTLRTNLRFLEASARRSLLFTAVDDDRDGAQVPANLAWSLAQAGRKVLLVDLDLRGNAVARTLGIQPGSGVADILEDGLEPGSVVRGTDHPNVKVLLSGDSDRTPSDLLSGSATASLLRRLERDHDYLVLHAPPVLTSSDAAVVASVSSATFVTAGLGRARAPEMHSALDALDNVQVAPFGLVLVEPHRNTRGHRGRVPPARSRRPLRAH